MITLLLALAAAQPVLEVPARNARHAGRIVRQLAELGFSASPVRVGESTRVRFDIEPPDEASAVRIAEEVGASLGHGVLVFGDPTSQVTSQSTPASASLLEAMTTAPHLTFRFSRELDGEVIAHVVRRQGSEISVEITAAGEYQSSRLLRSRDRATLWTETERIEASAEQLELWIGQLSPESVLAEALEAGFGGASRPAEGCLSGARRLLCVDTVASEGGAVTLFRGASRTSNGRWIPDEILRFSASDQEDRVFAIEISFPDTHDQRWFDPDFPGMRLSP